MLNLDVAGIGVDGIFVHVIVGTKLDRSHDQGKENGKKDGSRGDHGSAPVSPEVSPGKF
jgi:hypothetical protein